MPCYWTSFQKVVSNFIFIISYENLCGGDFGENFKVARGFTPIVSAGLEGPNDGAVLVYFRLSNCLLRRQLWRGFGLKFPLLLGCGTLVSVSVIVGVDVGVGWV